MQYIISNTQQRNNLFSNVYNYIKTTYSLVRTEYINLGKDVIRVSCYADEIADNIEQQLTFTHTNIPQNYNAEIIVFKESSPKNFLARINSFFDIKKNMRLRLDTIVNRTLYVKLSKTNKENDVFAIISEQNNAVRIWDEEKRIYYYGLKDFSPQELIKVGHLFVHQIYRIIASPTRHLVHGAALGINNTGALVCARGGKGKSTLTVNALINGFDYISDDYLILDKTKDGLYASPIYSIITLSPAMQQKMGNFNGKYISENARFNKNVLNISAYHQQFKTMYPIKVCLFPNIANVETPSIISINKGRAITQLIHSTIIQTNDIYNTQTVNKLLDFLAPFNYYQINLSSDINKNTQCLKEFLTSYKETSNDRLCIK